MKTTKAPRAASTYKLYVTRSGKQFALFVVKDDKLTEVITSNRSELIHDYLQAEWPVGTVARWVVL